jgi:hypothetical protein
VGLNIDTTIALRTPGQLANLVNAILAADPVDETHWLEWKTDVNLTDRQWQARIAKFVLGVANRRPQVADRRARAVHTWPSASRPASSRLRAA